jgi:hypothetical protein
LASAGLWPGTEAGESVAPTINVASPLPEAAFTGIIL